MTISITIRNSDWLRVNIPMENNVIFRSIFLGDLEVLE